MRNPNAIKKVKVTCSECGKEYVIEAKYGDLVDWALGKPIQRAMPYLSDDERELLISQICPICFDKFIT